MPATLFPILEPHAAEGAPSLPPYREAAWDFVNGCPRFRDGEPVTVTGREAVKTWVYKALLTQRCRYRIYTFRFGSELESLVGQNYTVHTKRAEAVRYVREALLINPYITDVAEVRVSFDLGDLKLSATVHTVYGEVTLHV